MPDPRVIEFHRLHEAGTFVMPNPWDLGSARILERLGFPALATTSAGFAWSIGKQDSRVALDEALGHLRALAAAVAVPLNADFQGGFADDPEIVAAHVEAAASTGVAGLSIEDSTGDAEHPLFEHALAVERVAAARAAIDRGGTGALLTARSEGYVVGHPDLDDTIRRLVAYAGAGADCLYAPRISSRDEVAAIVAAVAPKPVNLLVNAPFVTVEEAAALGVRRISVGGTLARAAWGGWLGAAREIAERGTFTAFQGLPDVESLLADG
ncbi:isocitrate lyase/PEP mutase family protein [Agrococcus sp. TSP3-2-1]|uniref:isocitrate lyase/PEP mutase family protein n=1 Tax=Agrococcus sp. TSP3-2-1 TaxID=2804583 RepID=UPI003CEEEBBE